MQSKTKWVLGSLVGAVAIHVGLAACGDGKNDPGSDGGLLDGLFSDGDARGDTDAGACSCTVTGPLKTADTDATRLKSGTLAAGSFVKVVDGPFVLTDTRTNFSFSDNGVAYWLVPQGQSCPTSFVTQAPILTELRAPAAHPDVQQMHGARFLVPAGQTLCAGTGPTPASWAGFSPYP